MEEKELSFKEAIEELEKITETLESGELELEKSIALFERGIELIKYCQGKLDTAQSRVQALVESIEGEVKGIPFEEQKVTEDSSGE